MIISKKSFHVLTARKIGSMQLRKMHQEHIYPVLSFTAEMLGEELIKNIQRDLANDSEAHFYILIRPPRRKFWSAIVQTIQSNNVPYIQLLTKEACPRLGNDITDILKRTENNPDINNCIIAMVQKYLHHMVLDKHCDLTYYPFVNAILSDFSRYHDQITLIDIDNITPSQKRFLVKNKLLQDKMYNSVSNKVPYEWSNYDGIAPLINRHIEPFELIYKHMLLRNSHLLLSNRQL